MGAPARPLAIYIQEQAGTRSWRRATPARPTHIPTHILPIVRAYRIVVAGQSCSPCGCQRRLGPQRTAEHTGAETLPQSRVLAPGPLGFDRSHRWRAGTALG